jgi:hypothetical protein
LLAFVPSHDNVIEFVVIWVAWIFATSGPPVLPWSVVPLSKPIVPPLSGVWPLSRPGLGDGVGFRSTVEPDPEPVNGDGLGDGTEPGFGLGDGDGLGLGFGLGLGGGGVGLGEALPTVTLIDFVALPPPELVACTCTVYVPFLSEVVFQPTKQLDALEHVRSLVPFATNVMLVMLPDETVAFPVIRTFEPLTVAPDAGDVIVMEGVFCAVTLTLYQRALLVTGLQG